MGKMLNAHKKGYELLKKNHLKIHLKSINIEFSTVADIFECNQ